MKIRMILAAAALLFAFASCEKTNEGLSAPELRIETQTTSSFIVAWNPVEGADRYDWQCAQGAGSVTSPRLSLTDLATDVYTVRVRAVSSASGAASQWSEIVVNLSGGSTDLPSVDFGLNVELQSDGYTVYVSANPEDESLTYYYEVVTASVYNKFDSPQALFEDMMLTYSAYFGGTSAAYERLARTGSTRYSYNLMSYGENNFYVVIGGINEYMNVSTVVQAQSFTIDLPMSSNRFNVEIEALTQSEIVVYVVPDNDDQYSIILQDTETVDAMSETQLRSFISGLVNENNLCTGSTAMTYTNNIVPSHDYTVLVFGWNSEGYISTPINRTDIRTPDAETVDELTFDFYVEVDGPQAAYVEITPSNLQAAYFFDMMLKSDWTETYQANPSQYIKDACGTYWTEINYLTRFGSVGVDYNDYDHYYLSPGNDYVVFALGYNVDENENITYLPAQYHEFSTPADTETPDPSTLSFTTFNMLSDNGVGGTFNVRIVPSDLNAPYVYFVMTEDEWDDALYRKTGTAATSAAVAFLQSRQTAQGYEGTFADYVQSISTTGEVYGPTSERDKVIDGVYNYKMVGMFYSVDDSGNVTFSVPQESGWYENW